MHAKSVLYRLIASLVILSIALNFFPIRGPVRAASAAVTPDGSPAAAQAPGVVLPSLADSPLSISRVQSAYIAGSTTITFTLTNNLPPTLLPEVPSGATYTDTLDILAGFSITEDVNTLHSPSLTDSLAPGVTLLAASGNPVQNGSSLTWSLEDLPPLTSTAVTLTVQTPAGGANFIDLDSGAQFSAERWGQPVSTAAAPAVIAPTGVSAATTQSTPDANLADADMLWKSAEFAQDPLSAFDLLRSFSNDPYSGSLRGTRGTLWGEAGNSIDKSSLLIAMLRAAGIPARYRHGSLSTAQAQTLLAGMFPASQGVGGYLPAGVALGDPVNDPALIGLVSDHWWVEAYLPGQGWTNLDASFATAQPGDIFAVPATDGSDRIVALPAALSYRVDLELQVEQYSAFPINGANLTTLTPISATYTLAELAARAVTLGHFVSTESAGGLTFSTVTHTYAPFFATAGDDFLTLGSEFQDILTNFPLGSNFTTAEWLKTTITSPDGSAQSFTRELKDLIGLDARLNGGNPVIALPADNSPFTSLDDLFAAWFLPNRVQNTQYARRLQAQNAYLVLAAARSTNDLPDPIATPAETQAFRQAKLDYFLTRNDQYAVAGLEFTRMADPAAADIEASLRVKLFYDQPRIIIASRYGLPDGSAVSSLDLRSTQAAGIVYPGQALSALHTAQWTKGVVESYYETEIAARLTESIPVSVARIFDAMHAQGILPVLITPAEMDLLDLYAPDDQRSAHARQALLEGKNILIPSAPVLLDGQQMYGWWEIDPQSGETISVLENGQHSAALEYIAIFLETWDSFDDAQELSDAVDTLWSCIASSVVAALQGTPIPPLDCLADFKIPNTAWPPWYPDPIKWATGQQPLRGDLLEAALTAASWRSLPAYLCPVDNCGIEQFSLPYPNPSPIPLPEILFGYNDRFGGEDQAGLFIPVMDNGAGGADAFSLSASPASGSVLPGELHTFDLSASANFSGAVDAWIYAPSGWQVRLSDTGQVEAVARPGTLPGDYALQIVAQSEGDPGVISTIQYPLNIPDAGDLYLAAFPEDNLTIPSGSPAFSAASNQTNDGEGEYPESAFLLAIANYSAQTKTLTLTANGAPAGWLVLNGAVQNNTSFTLGANQRTIAGLYVVPTTPLIPGTSFNISVTLSDGQGNVENVSIPWNMPAQAHSFLQLSPQNLYLASTGSAEIAFSLQNVGNASGSFPISAILPPVSASLSSLPAPLALNVGETQAFTATLSTSGLTPGMRFPLLLASPAPASYTQYSQTMVQIVSALTAPVFAASTQMATVCTLGEPQLSAALQSLALAMVRLENSCQVGTCDLALRDQLVSAVNSSAIYARAVSPSVTQDDSLQSISAALSGHTTSTDLLADLADLSAAISALETEVCALSAHLPELRWTPAYSASLTGQPATLNLALTNLGSLSTSYALTVTLPAGQQVFAPSLAPGGTTTLPFQVAPAAVGIYDLTAEVSVPAEPFIQDSALARLNVVDRYLQLTAVTPNPPFVETGVSSTTISIAVSNFANLALPVTARTTILDPTSAPVYTNDISLTVLAGAPRSYSLQTVDTSGWAAGVYTVTVDLLGSSGAPVAGGAGYGYLGVGQALGIQHALQPIIVQPGTVTVTTHITSELLTPVIVPLSAGLRQSVERLTIAAGPTGDLPVSFPPQAPQSTDAITRTDDLDPAIIYTGSWTPITTIAWARHASAGSYTVSSTSGDTAAFTFNGTWLHLGFSTGWSGGQAEILIDGVSHGIVDLYTNQTADVASYVYSGLVDTAHTLTIQVLGTANPNANGTDVMLDYIDTWDGTLYPDGLVEQTSTRVWRSLDWTDVADPDASGGTYMQNNVNGSAWFPFTGDSVSFVAFANPSSTRVSVSIDGIWQTNMNVYNSTDITRTISFDNLGPGPHVLQLRRYYFIARVDAFITPAITPGYAPPAYAGIVRYEADHPALTYNGDPIRSMPLSFTRDIEPNVSDSSVVRSTTLSDTISMIFNGVWVSIGVRARSGGGYGEVFIDGASVGIVDSLSTSEELRSFAFGGLITGTHTLEIVVLDAPNPSTNNVYLDYIDVWDGSTMPDDFTNARKSEDVGRLHYSVSGVDETQPNAIQGDIFASGLPNTNSNVWYSFTGDSFTFYGLSRDNTSTQEVFLDGQLIDTVSLSYPFSEQVLLFHYTGLPAGPHTVRIHNTWEMRVDGFASNPTSLNAFQPLVEWHESTQTRGASIWGGLHVPPTVGDVNGDGSPEIVVATSNIQSNGELFLLRGDGGDTGDGDPIIWSVPYNIFNGFEDVGSPAIAELDGLPGAEIIHPTIEGIYVYHSDGSTYWFTDTVQSHVFFAAPAVGNLDLDPEPEIVVNMNHDLVVFEPDGTIAWQQTFPAALSMPVLADLNVDGLLDILVHESGTTNVYAYSYNFGVPTLLWGQTVNSSLHIYGGPAVVDVDGMQPGGDALPEVAIASEGWLQVLNGEDGSQVWAVPLDSGRSGSVSAADLDGDGEVELVTGMQFNGGRIYAVNADGSLLWSAPALDNSPLNVSVMDLNDDGIYEVAWNGATGGFTLFNGPDGAVLFNEPHPEIISQTGSDYPVFADVDGDGYGEVVVASQAGLRVFGFDGVWGPSRPLWNQHSYHITNVNDDLSIPVNEPQSWTAHNTFRTQTSLVNPMPVFSIALTHTVGIFGVTVLTNTFNIPPDSQAGLDYGWDLSVSWESAIVTRTFHSRLDNLLPGEVRLVAQGTQADYTLSSGRNHLALPPLYAAAEHILTIDPPLRVVGPGASLVYTVILTNTATQNQDYQLSLAGLPPAWSSLPAQVSVPAGSSAAVSLSVSVPLDAQPQSLPFSVSAAASLGYSDQAGAALQVTAPLLAAAITPAERSAPTGESVTYTLTITNLESVDRLYDLTPGGMAQISLPPQVSVPAGSAASVVFSAQAAQEGPNPIDISVAESHGYASALASAILNGIGAAQVEVTIDPASANGGPGVATLYTVTVANPGTHPETFDLSVTVPAGWQSELSLLGSPVSAVLVGPGLSNAVQLQLVVTPAANAALGSYPLTVSASGGGASSSASADLLVGDRGVLVEFISGPATLLPDGSGTWQVRVTNTGGTAGTYDLSAFGVFGPTAQLTPGTLSLNPGQSQTVQLTAGPLGFSLPQVHILGVLATLQSNPLVVSQDTTPVTISAVQAAQVAWLPPAQTISGTLSASFTLVVTNTGNVNTEFSISASAVPAAGVQPEVRLLEIPARGAAHQQVVVTAPQGGVYQLSAAAQGGAAQASANATLTVIYTTAPPKMFLPLVLQAAGFQVTRQRGDQVISR